MDWYLMALKKYAEFQGRSQRKEYWMFTLFNLLAFFVLSIVGSVLGDQAELLTGLYSLGVLLPSIAVTVRRLHDIGKSGWFLLLGLIPLVNFYLLFLLVQPSQSDSNQFGAPPVA